MGASNKAIRNQFLFEFIIIGQLYGVIGTVLGSLMPMALQADFIVPWNCVILGVEV